MIVMACWLLACCCWSADVVLSFLDILVEVGELFFVSSYAVNPFTTVIFAAHTRWAHVSVRLGFVVVVHAFGASLFSMVAVAAFS